jgi:hypothetical protein
MQPASTNDRAATSASAAAVGTCRVSAARFGFDAPQLRGISVLPLVHKLLREIRATTP